MEFEDFIKLHPGIDWNNPINGRIAWEAAQAAERDACAKIAETLRANGVKVDPYSWIADVIRARTHNEKVQRDSGSIIAGGSRSIDGLCG